MAHTVDPRRPRGNSASGDYRRGYRHGLTSGGPPAGPGASNGAGTGWCPMLWLGLTQTTIRLVPLLVALTAVRGRSR